ncbi:MAG TPA: hypothetical protein VGF55_30565, partial [Gemmataceae bacterium]
MSNEAVILIVFAAVAYGLVGVSAFLILLGRRAGWFGVAASVVATLFYLTAAAIATGMAQAVVSFLDNTTMSTFWAAVTAAFVSILPLLLALMLPVGWLLYAHRRYRQARQDELLQVIATAAESGLPLAPAVRAYLHDRPRDGRAAWDALLLFVFPPGYLVWTQRRTFDDRVARLSALLAAGAPLPEALKVVRGVAPGEVKIAAEVGETTGRLAACLRRADRDRLAGVWLEVLPRILYPFLVLLAVGGVATFLALFVMPKFQKIFADLGQTPPPVTTRLIELTDSVTSLDIDDDMIATASMVVFGLIGLIALIAVSPFIRWHLPVIGRLFRWETQGLVLRMLAALFDAGWPAPKALGLLAGSAAVPGVVRRRLVRAQQATARGEPLPDALSRAGLLPAGMAPLVAASEKTRTLP